MKKTFLGIAGITLFLFAIFLGRNLQKDENLAVALDDKKKGFAVVGEDSPPFCKWNTDTPDRVMAEDKSQAIVIKVSNPEKKTCESYLTLRAPGFEFSPAKEEQKISLLPQKNGSLSWILMPRKTGTYELAVSDIVNTQVFGITVTNMFGLSAAHAKVFSMLGTLLGPMLTVPWWIDRWFQFKQKQQAKKAEQPQSK